VKQQRAKTAVLALADGRVFQGIAFGAEADAQHAVTGEVVFNTSMYGYQEILTDPSYAGQIMCFTYPQIGNVGCNPDDVESDKVYVEGVLIRNLSRIASNFRSTMDLNCYLERAGIMGVAEIDTRSLVQHLRDRGAQMGAMACGDSINPDDLVDLARRQGGMEGKDYVHAVSCREPYLWNGLPWSWEQGGYRKISQDKLCSRPHVVAMDFGIKHNILRLLLGSGFRVTVVPADYSSEQILALAPDALFLSNGPGDPAALAGIVDNMRQLLGRFPIFGICLGHQILGLALGGRTYKLKFGHRGGNHPVMDMSTSKVEITVQNHGFAVAAEGFPSGVKLSHINLNDRTVEGLEVPDLRVFCIQYHPEASPGPHDARYLFRRFFESVVGYKNGGH
jgi:carbamoyl-phosphate synthase small subunit